MKPRAIPYSDAEMAWLEANRTLVISDYHQAFVARFGRDDVRQNHLHALRKRKGWKVGRAGGRYVGRHRRYSPAEIAWLSANRTLTIGRYHEAFAAEFGRTDVTAAHLVSLRKRQGWRTGTSGRFAKGAPSWNRGKPCAPGTGGRHPNSQRAHFRKGERTGRAKEVYQPIGTERVSEGGYLQRKMHEGRPFHSRWQLVQRIEWEKVNGPIPAGMVLKCLDGNKLNTAPSNWEPIPRGVLSRLNGGRFKKRLGYDAAPEEVRPTLMAMAKVEHALHERRKVRP